MISLQVVSVSFGQFQAGAYTLILAEENGNRKIPVIIGTPEAHSIVSVLEGMKPPRPMTHDLFVSFSKILNVRLSQVNISKYKEGVFYSELVFDVEGKIVCIDSRTSDAVALAIRFQSAIFTTEEVMKETGIVFTDESDIWREEKQFSKKGEVPLKTMNLRELQIALEEAIDREDYEKASYIRDLIKKR
ncbi:bifunctional nuclease family protein [Candidatus Azobacteroides pseudotrichonymphae]|uniref:BFN domain-containing protein n=1 Tax=Azobacteroides pseudotrichonymphae genomovar. CFP2 TaxID=511995 RepID=B6YR47_AZOPC|nr:bifunctional nuclease family protein [Candidatus Azobacteroides pseudotrichonymphae]BAG83669.1 conserved hypothetical protein [Candidatus Azobacteroides pseudotrichonymphae genomovar. CFP2]